MPDRNAAAVLARKNMTTMRIQQPNFFILGAPKCGTTSLAAWLGDHPQIFMSTPKEPNFFNSDHVRPIYTKESYESLFRKANSRHLAVGEASVWYLYSKLAASHILEYNNSARFIVCLRNPIEMAPALHEQKLFSGFEHIADFEAAWHLSDQRMRGIHVKPWSREPTQLSYKNACLLGQQCERLLSVVPRARVHFILLEDMSRDPRREYLKVLSFLRLSDDGRSSFARLNAAKERSWPRLARMVALGNFIKQRAGLRVGFGISNRLQTMNFKERPRDALRPELKEEMRSFFLRDIQRLSAILKRDLQHWLS